MAHHKLKCDIRFFQSIVDCKMRAINRLNDRGFEIGDYVLLEEGYLDASTPDGFFYTGRNVAARISYIDNFGVQENYVTLSLSDVGLIPV